MSKSEGSNLYTPARQMGLSRIKKTPNNSLLQINSNQSSSHLTQLNTPPPASLKSKTEITKSSDRHSSLLTPCRQMGLSRKRKASNLLQITPTQSSPITVHTLELNTTPITSNIEFEKASASRSKFEKNYQINSFKEDSGFKNCITEQESTATLTSRFSHVSVENEKPKHNNKNKNVSKCLNKLDKNVELNTSPKPLSTTKSDIFCDNDLKQSKRKKLLKCIDVGEFASTLDSSIKKHINRNSKNENCSKNKDINFNGFTPLHTNESLNAVKNFNLIYQDTIFNRKIITNEENPIGDVATIPEAIHKSSTLKTYTNKKKWKRTLSLKKSTEEIKKPDESVASTATGDTKTIPCTIKLHKLNIKSEMINISELSVNISKLEKENDKQRKILQDLKQAQVYTKLHNIRDVEKSTETWKNGCKAALNDLLPQINATSPNIDMGTLLNNLGVPANLIKLLPSGDLG